MKEYIFLNLVKGARETNLSFLQASGDVSFVSHIVCMHKNISLLYSVSEYQVTNISLE